MKINRLKNRLLFVSPTVQAGWQQQLYRTDFQVLQTLGQGTFGVVWKGRHKKTKKVYAIKQVKKRSLINQKAIDQLRKQIKIMYSLNHPNIIKLYNHFEDELSIYLVIQFAEKGELYKALIKQKQHYFSQETASKYIFQIVCALNDIHEKNIIHRDIKPQNILISSEGTLKLADFGWSSFINEHQKRQTYCGTLDYLAPEMLTKQHKHDGKVDIWGVGVLIFELCTGMSPFSSELMKTNMLTEDRVKKNILSLNYKIPQFLSNQCQDLIKRLLVTDPEKRLTINQIICHPWLRKYEQKEKSIKKDRKNWLQSLKNQFSSVIQQSANNNHHEFSDQEIYSYSRIQSVINLKPQKQHQANWAIKKIADLQMKIKEMEFQHKMNENQIKRLKESKGLHSQCQDKEMQLIRIIKSKNNQIETLNTKLIIAEQKNRQLQLNQFK